MADSGSAGGFTADTFERISPLLLKSMFWRPAYISLSAWLDHLPFAFWLIEAQRPRTVVELGTHCGASYFAFCQAVDRLGLDTTCYAVDTWKGDEHAGFYGEDVFAGVNAHNEARYSGFSRLVRSTFDDALGHFSDGTIDLLHIDGLHTLEAVSHDFESWLPKLTDNAIVVFHDTNVRERGFGVYQVFEKLRKTYPSFEFVHGHGLGILGVGKEQRPLLSRLFEANENPQLRRSIRDVFSRLGTSCSQSLRLQTKTDQKRAVESKLAEVQAALAAAKSAAATREAELSSQLTKLDGERVRLLKNLESLGRSHEQESAAYEARLAQLEFELGDRSHEVPAYAAHGGTVTDRSAEVAELTRRLQAREQEISTYKAKVREFEQELTEQASEIETLTQRLDAASAEVGHATGATAAALARAAEAEARVEQLSAEISILKAEADARAEESQSRAEQEVSDVARLDATVADRFRELATVTRLLKDKTSEAEKLARGEAVALARTKEAEAVAERYKADVTRLEANMAERFREIATLSRLLKEQEHQREERGREHKEQQPVAQTGRRAPLLSSLAEVNGKSVSERLAFVSGGAQEAAIRLRRAFEPIGGLKWRLLRQRRLVKASGLFDGPWYLARNPDVAAAGADPLDHFLLFGGQEGRPPSPAFDSGAYLRDNPDVAKSGINPLVHYLANGKTEGRRFSALR